MQHAQDFFLATAHGETPQVLLAVFHASVNTGLDVYEALQACLAVTFDVGVPNRKEDS